MRVHMNILNILLCSFLFWAVGGVNALLNQLVKLGLESGQDMTLIKIALALAGGFLLSKLMQKVMRFMLKKLQAMAMERLRSKMMGNMNMNESQMMDMMSSMMGNMGNPNPGSAPKRGMVHEGEVITVVNTKKLPSVANDLDDSKPIEH